MINLYESILSGMEETLDIGDTKIDNISANSANSVLRHIFPSTNTDLFNIINDKTKTLFVKKTGRLANWVYADLEFSVSEVVAGVDTIKIEGSAAIVCDENISKTLAKNIIADNISIHKCNKLKDVNFTIKQVDTSSRLLGSVIQFGNNTKSLENCNIETISTGKQYTGKMIFTSIPEFKNVSSDTVEEIFITPSTILFGPNTALSKDIVTNTKLNNLFDFSYKITYSDDAGDLNFNIKNLKDIKKLVAVYNPNIGTFNSWPVKIKKNAKINDFLDVSKFKNLHKITVNDVKFGITFINIKYLNTTSLNGYRHNMLKTSNKAMEINIDDIPTTVDGWKVIVHKMY